MLVSAIYTRRMCPPKDDLLAAMQDSELSLQEGDCLAISSKVVSVWEGQCVKVDPSNPAQRDELAKAQAAQWLPREEVPERHALWTRTQGNLISGAGIDASNAHEHLIVWPQDPHASAERVRAWCSEHYNVKQLAVIVTDSHSIPLRRGAVGFALGWAGFDPLVDHRGATDLFGRAFISEHTNLADSMAATAVLAMGETNESTPIAVLRDVPYLGGQLSKTPSHTPPYTVTPEEDIFAPFWRGVAWRRGSGGS